jgi:predicted enzyme related to lactoylglutathione lyase
MAVLRPHLALTVTDVDRAIPFYEALFGVTPEKVRPGYAKFSVTEPAMNFTLNQGGSRSRAPTTCWRPSCA